MNLQKYVSRKSLLLAAAGALTATSGMVLSPASSHDADAALPTPFPAGPELTSFNIDGDTLGPDDWDDPYTAPGTSPIGYATTGLMPANFFPTFSAPDFPNPAATPVPNPAFGFFPARPEFCEDSSDNDSEDGWLNPAGEGKLASLRLATPAVSNQGGQVLGCPPGNPQNKTDLLDAYAAFEILEVPDPGGSGGSHNEFILYGGWRRGDNETGELNFYIPVSDGVDGPIDIHGWPTNTAGDRVIQFNFDNSGTFAFGIWGWNELTTAWEIIASIPTGSGNEFFDAAVGSGNGSAFGEFAINLTSSGILPDDDTAGCRTVQVADYVFTATGNADDATLQDYVEGPGFPFTNCGSLEVEKTAPFTPDTPVDFSFAANQVDLGTMFPAVDVPTTTPASTTTQLNDSLSYPQPGTFPNPETYIPIIAQPDYQIAETALPAGWQLQSLECTYKDIFNPILDADGNPTGDFNTVVNVFDGTTTPFAIPPVLDVDGDLVIDQTDIDAMQTSCVITNDANSITIVKDAVPDDATADFEFVSKLGAAPEENFTLNDPTDPSKTFIVAQDEANQFLELTGNNPPFWDLTALSCEPDDAQITIDTSTGVEAIVTIGAGPVRHVTCTFTNTERQQPYQILVTPTTDTNRLTDDHTYTVELRTDADEDGALDDPVVGATVDLSWAGPVGSQITDVNGAPITPTNSTTCVTQDGSNPLLPEGTCEVTVGSPTNVGSGALTASFTLPDPGAGVPELPTGDQGTTCTTPTIVGGVITVCNEVQDVERIEASGDKTWVGYEVTVEPDGTNPLGAEHIFTIDVVRTDGTTDTAVVDGTVVNFTWTGPAGSQVIEVNGAPDVDATSCSTVGGGCTVTVDSDTSFGAGTLTVTNVEGDLIGAGVRTETPTPDSDLTASKTWVDWRVTATPPTATNAVDQDHLFTLLLERNDGTGWVAETAGSIDVSWSGPAGSTITALSAGTIDAPPVTATCEVDASGECEVTVSSAANGAGTLTATSVNVSLAGYAPPGAADGAPFDFDIDDETADKTWVAIRGTVTPPTATNLVGASHEFTIFIETIDGNGSWVPAPEDTIVAFSWTGGVGAVTSVIDPGPDATSCELRADGTCLITVDSDTPGSGTLTITGVTSIVIDGVQLVPPGGSLPVSDADPSPDLDSREGVKTWIRFEADVQATATNVVGDSHNFTITATYDNGAGLTPVPDGSTATFTWNGSTAPTGATPTGNPNEFECTTAGGSCTVTVSSTTTESGTIAVTELTADVGGSTHNAVTTTTPPSLVASSDGSLSATKTWIEFEASVAASATNLAGEDHDFTITVGYNDGAAPDPEAVPDGSTATFTWVGDGTVSAGGTPTGDPDEFACTLTAGECTVTVSSATAGQGTITVTGVSAMINSTVFTDVAPVAAPQGSLTANKTWIAFDVDITPGTDTNLTGDPHTFTITVTVDDGTGAAPLPIPPNSGSVVWSFAAPDGSTPTDTCTLVAGGTCTVDQNSAVPGTGTLTATSLSVNYNGVDFGPIDLTSVGSGQSPDLTIPPTAEKTWITVLANVEATGTNLAGNDHTFTLSAFYDDGTGLPKPADGAEFAFTWTGTGTAVPPTTCTAVPAENTCDVVVSSAVAGSGTITIGTVTMTVNGVTFTDTVPAATAGGSLTADKTWIVVSANVESPATNLSGDDHMFTLSAFIDGGGGDVPANGATFAYTWTGTETESPAATCTAASGTNTCEVTVSSAVAGAGTLTIDTVTVTAADGTVFTDVVPATATGGSLSAQKSWISFDVDVTPTGSNPVGVDHIFTILARIDQGQGLSPLTDGKVVFTWTGAGAVTAGGTPTANPGEFTCTITSTSDPAGTCEVTVTSAAPGSGSITVTELEAFVDPTNWIVDFTQAGPGQAPSVALPVEATKTWVDWRVTVTPPSATNAVDQDHIFTLLLERNDGTGWVAETPGSIDVSWAGPAGSAITAVSAGTIDAPPTTATCDVDASGECDVTVSSATNGTGTLTATSVNVSLAGYAPPGAANGAQFDFDIVDETADKTWVAIRGTVTPDGVNIVGDAHDFTLLVETQDDGGTWVPAPAGTVATFTWTGDGAVTNVDEPGPNATSCTLRDDDPAGQLGTCAVTVDSATPGSGFLSLQTVTSLIVNGEQLVPSGGSLPIADDDPSMEVDSRLGFKTWIQFVASVTPSATNLTGEDHEFTISVSYDDGSTVIPVPDGSTATYTWGPDGTAVPPTQCTITSGTCTVTVSSTDAGSGTLEITEVEATIGGDVVTGDPDATPPGVIASADGSLEASKTWVEFDVDITPGTATNRVDDAHTFTITVRVNDGTGLVPLPVGPTDTNTVDWSFAAPDGTTPTGFCTLVPGGTCTVEQNSATPGTGTLTATQLTAQYNGETLVVDLSASGDGQSPDLTVPPTAEKTWVELLASVETTGTNIVGDDHVFTLSAFFDDGGGEQAANGAVFAFTWAGDGTALPAATCTADAAANTCEVTVSSDDPGAGTLTIDTVTVTVLGETFTDVVPVAAAGGSLSADKTWVRFEADVQSSATNLIGDDHEFTITATYDDGTATNPVPDGSTATYTWGPDGTAVPPTGCTFASGTCTVTVSSATPGSGTLEITEIEATIGGDVVTGDPNATPPGVIASSGGSLEATKTWIEVRADVQTTATNLSGDDHVFTLSAFITDDGTTEQPANGAIFDFTWTGTTATPAATCTAAPTENTCEVTVSSAVAASGTLTIDTVTVTAADGTTFTDVVPAAATGGQLAATKTWIAFDVDITPETALNPRGEEHIFTITVRVDEGSGLGELLIPPNSGSVAWSFDATDGSTITGMCTLTAGGDCDVAQNSAILGTGTLTATALTVNYDNTDFGPIDLTTTGSGQSPDLTIPPTAEKVWGGYELVLDPETAVNLWPTQPDHVVTLTLDAVPDTPLLPIDAQDLDVTLTSTVATITAVSNGTILTPTTATCTTDAVGECEVTITSTGPGAATLSASYTATIGNFPPILIPADNDADKVWRTFRVNVTPQTAQNLLGVPHTFTVTVEQTDDGTTWTPVQGAVPTTVVSAPAQITGETCSAGTDASGECTVTATSPTAAEVTLSATYIGSVDSATAEFGDEGDKTWIDYLVEVDPPTAENLVGTQHIFTVSVLVDRGGGAGFEPIEGAIPAITIAGPGEITGETCSAGTAADGTCTVTITSTTPGLLTVTASFEGTAGDGESGTFSGAGEKTWIDYRIDVDPDIATNNTGDPHVFTVTLEVDRGNGFGPASGETVQLATTGVGQIIDIDAAGGPANTCATDGNGQCRVTVNSTSAGSLTLTAIYDADVGGTERTFAESGQKNWIDRDLPSTGGGAGRIIRIAAAIMLLGLMLVLLARRRRSMLAAA